MKLFLIVAAVLGPTVCGCAGSHEIKQGTVYPTGLKRGTTLDIQVIRRSTKIELTNTTARPFGKSTLWLNGRYSKEIDSLAVGQKLTFWLKEFKDEYGESFRGGGFFSTQRAEMLALAELHSGDEMMSLVVVRGDE